VGERSSSRFADRHGGDAVTPRSMLIDEFAPSPTFGSVHAVDVAAPCDDVYGCLRTLDLAGSPVVRTLLAVRGMRRRGPITVDGFLGRGFLLLGEDPPHELVLGLIARPWKPRGGIVRVAPGSFAAFGEPGYAKVAWNFSCRPAGGGVSTLATETRVECTDEVSRVRFGRYWRLVGPFSGLMRREMLAAVAAAAEDR